MTEKLLIFCSFEGLEEKFGYEKDYQDPYYTN